MLWTQVKYLNLISYRLERFKKKDEAEWVARCPICGDSKYSKRKTRFYVYERGGNLLVYCHNCNYSTNFSTFLRTFDPGLFLEMSKEEMLDSGTRYVPGPVKKIEITPAMLDRPITLPSISSLASDHQARAFLENRKIPSKFYPDLFFAERYFTWAATIDPTKQSFKGDEPRIVIPFRRQDGLAIGFQGRALGKSDLKYASVKKEKTAPFLFGMDRVNFNNPIYVTEGPFDAMFIPNAIATGGGDLVRELQQYDREKFVLVMDNEPRSPQTIKKMEKAIGLGFSIVVWPESLQEKDLNEMFLSGKSSLEIKQIIDSSVVSGLAAASTIALWSRVNS